MRRQSSHRHEIDTTLLTPNVTHSWAADVQLVLHQTPFVPHIEKRANQVQNKQCCFILLAHENIEIREAFTGLYPSGHYGDSNVSWSMLCHRYYQVQHVPLLYPSLSPTVYNPQSVGLKQEKKLSYSSVADAMYHREARGIKLQKGDQREPVRRR